MADEDEATVGGMGISIHRHWDTIIPSTHCSKSYLMVPHVSIVARVCCALEQVTVCAVPVCAATIRRGTDGTARSVG